MQCSFTSQSFLAICCSSQPQWQVASTGFLWLWCTVTPDMFILTATKRFSTENCCFFLAMHTDTHYAKTTIQIKKKKKKNNLKQIESRSKCVCVFVCVSVCLCVCACEWWFSTWHVAFCFATLHPLPSLIPPVVLVSQNHVHIHVVMSRRVQRIDIKAEKREHPPVQRKVHTNQI